MIYYPLLRRYFPRERYYFQNPEVIVVKYLESISENFLKDLKHNVPGKRFVQIIGIDDLKYLPLLSSDIPILATTKELYNNLKERFPKREIRLLYNSFYLPNDLLRETLSYLPPMDLIRTLDNLNIPNILSSFFWKEKIFTDFQEQIHGRESKDLYQTYLEFLSQKIDSSEREQYGEELSLQAIKDLLKAEKKVLFPDLTRNLNQEPGYLDIRKAVVNEIRGSLERDLIRDTEDSHKISRNLNTFNEFVAPVIFGAAKKNRREVVRYLVAETYDYHSALRGAAVGNHSDLLDFILEIPVHHGNNKGDPLRPTTWEDLEEEMVEEDFYIPDELVELAIKSGSDKVIKWFIDRHYRFETPALYLAFKYENLSLAKFIIESRRIQLDRIIESLIFRNSLSAIQWLMETKFSGPTDVKSDLKNSRTLISAAASGNLNILKYLLSKNIKMNVPLSEDDIIFFYLDEKNEPESATVENREEIVKFFGTLPRFLLATASKHGHREMLKYLLNLFPEDEEYAIPNMIDHPELLDLITFKGSSKVVQYYLDHPELNYSYRNSHKKVGNFWKILKEKGILI